MMLKNFWDLRVFEMVHLILNDTAPLNLFPHKSLLIIMLFFLAKHKYKLSLLLSSFYLDEENPVF